MENEFMKRGYLLPEGCKDLSDVAHLKTKQDKLSQFVALTTMTKMAMLPAPLPPVTKQVFISPLTTVKKLADLLESQPFEILCDLRKLGVFAVMESTLDFQAISDVARMHGFLAIKAGLL
jgi:hypothetical protein